MKYCNSCKVSVDSSRKTCPLCYEILENPNDVVSTQEYPKPAEKKKKGFFFRFFLFLSVVASGICVFLNIMNYNVASEVPLWSILVVSGIIYFWITIKYTFMGRGVITYKLALLAFVHCIIILLVNIVIGFENKWSIAWVMPFIFVSHLFTILVISFANKKIFVDSIVAILIFGLLSIIPYIVYHYGHITERIPALVSMFFGLASIVLLFVFKFPDVKEELKKRLHF